MNIKEVEKARALIDRGNIIENKIIKLDQVASRLVNGETKVKLKIKARKSEEDTETTDLDDSPKTERSFRSYYFSMFSLDGSRSKKNEDYDSIGLSDVITDELLLGTIGFIIGHLRDEQKKILKELRKIGIQV